MSFFACRIGCPSWCPWRVLDSLANFGAIYILFACLLGFPHLHLFYIFFRTYLLPYLPFPLIIGPLCFQAGCRKRRLNLTLVFFCLFYVVVYFFWLVNACFCCVWFSFSIPSQGIGLENVFKWPVFVLNETYNFNSINPGVRTLKEAN